MKFLLVEDNKELGVMLSKLFTREGWQVDVAGSGEEGLALAASGHYDLLVLDVTLPLLSGFETLTELRRNGDTTPALFLTSCGSVEERVRGLDLGADDYVTKPFEMGELLARVRAVLRRNAAVRLRSHDLELDLEKQRVCRAGRPLDLTAKEFSLLSFLMRHRGQPVSRAAISRAVLDCPYDGETNAVDVLVSRLRDKLDGPFPRPLIRTVRGVGYTLTE